MTQPVAASFMQGITQALAPFHELVVTQGSLCIYHPQLGDERMFLLSYMFSLVTSEQY